MTEKQEGRKQEDGKTRRQKDKKTERQEGRNQEDGKTRRQKNKMTEKQEGRKQEDRKTRRLKNIITIQWAPLNGITDNRINRLMGSN